VNAVSFGENERLHLWIPATGLVTEVDSSLQELFEAYVRHTTFSVLGGRLRPDQDADGFLRTPVTNN
jgi:hypothetical protein